MLRVAFAAVSALLLLSSAAAAGAARVIVNRDYDCKIIASTREFPGAGPFSAPAMNGLGQVVFQVNGEVRVGRGDLVNGIPTSHVVATTAGPSPPFDSITEATIDDAAVTFLAYDSSGQAIYRVATNHPAAVKPGPLYADQQIDSGSPYFGFNSLPTLGANAAGSVVFQASTDNGTAFFLSGNEIARDFSDGVQIVNPPLLLHAHQPWTAFLASLDTPNSGNGIWVNGTMRLSSTPNGEGGFAGLSLSGTADPLVAYVSSGFPGMNSWELAASDPLGTSVYLDADVDPFERYGPPFETSINASGEVAFVTSLGAELETLFVADGSQEISRVVCVDQQAIFGSAFIDLALGPHAINDNGQIAFAASGFDDHFLVRAPEPASSWLAGAAVVALYSLRRSRVARAR